MKARPPGVLCFKLTGWSRAPTPLLPTVSPLDLPTANQPPPQTNYPFQSYAARFPVPGTVSNFGDITRNLYFSTTIGPIKLIVGLAIGLVESEDGHMTGWFPWQQGGTNSDVLTGVLRNQGGCRGWSGLQPAPHP